MQHPCAISKLERSIWRKLSAIGKALIVGALLAGCTLRPAARLVAPVTGLPQGSNGQPWWNDSIFYEIFVRSFYDSNGDGIGDFSGIIEKLDYLNDGNPKTSADLGISGIWLMPIQPSPSYHGYDVIDYTAVNPQYGTMEDFKRLLDEAHQRGIRVIIDLVLNHTSTEHPWFKATQDPGSEYRDWYVWSDTRPGGSGWYQGDQGYYFALFWVGMPDLNYTNPDVTSQMEDVARFWLEEVGVDGFRLDAAKHLIEEGPVQANTEATHAWWKQFRTYYKESNPQAVTVGEVWDSSAIASRYVQAGDELDLVFSFDLAQAMINTARAAWARDADNAITRDLKLYANSNDPQNPLFAQYATFLTNHDQPRAMTALNGDLNQAKSAASLLLTTPGVPFIYYGEEIGMSGSKPDERLRTPMQWSSAANGGFSSHAAWEALNDDYAQKNVADQLKDPASLLAHYRSLAQLRNAHVALRTGQYLSVETCSPAVLAFLRSSSAPREDVLVIINLDKEPLPECKFTLAEGPLAGNSQVFPLLNTGSAVEKFAALGANASGGFEAYQPLPVLEAYQTLILQISTAP